MRKALTGNCSQKGYTLLEVAMVMVILSLFVVAAIPLIKMYYKEQQYETTLNNQKIIDIAIEQFKETRGRYPCPARGNAEPNDPQYGRAVFDCAALTGPPGTCNNGLCFEVSERTVDVDGVIVTPLVIRGTLPFVDIELSPDESYDAYGGRYSYAVTALLTDKEQYRTNRGGISIVDGDDQSVIEPPASAHYFVFSHGEDGIGAYDREGNIGIACDGPMFDNQNCNTAPDQQQAKYRYTLHSEEDVLLGSSIPGGPPPPVLAPNRHFDDQVNYVGIGQQPTWEKKEDPATNDLMDSINLHSAVENKVILAGEDTVPDPDVEVLMQVDGDARVDNANRVIADLPDDPYCDSDKSDCTYSATIGAEDETDPRRLHCDDVTGNEAGKNVVLNALGCEKKEDFKFNCPAGEFAVGVDDVGRFICATAKVCKEKTIDVCGIAQQLPEALKGATQEFTGGATYQATYICKNNWKLDSESGKCVCNPGTKTTTTSCPGNMSGTITTTITTECPSGKKTKTETGNTCLCVPSKKTKTKNCPPGESGTIVTETEVTCVDNTPQTSTTVISNSCACTPQTKTKQTACGAGQTGKIQWEATSVCPSGTFGPWVETSNTCGCAPSSNKSVVCPPEFNVGSGVKSCSWNCSKSPAVETCTTDYSSCKCVESTYTTQKNCPKGYTGKIQVKHEVSCPGAVTKVTEDDSACVKDAVKTVSCKVGISGSKVGSGPTQWQDKEICTAPVSDNFCANIKYCGKTIGNGQYDIYQCQCK